jgi:F-type H+-transporting ATPase subunit a
VTSSAPSIGHALGSVIAAGPGFEAPGLDAFYPHPLFTFSVLGVDFAITRITLILWIATLAMIGFLVWTVRKPSIVPSKSQFLGESGYSLVRDGIARDVVGPRGLPFAPFLASLFFFILANNLMSIVPFAQISPMSKFAFPLVLAVICYVMYIWIGIREQGVGKYFKDILFLPGVPLPMYLLVTPIEILQNFIVRPFTLAVRLFANMFAGHMLLLVFSLGATYLFTVGGLSYVFGTISFLMAIVMSFFELLVIFLQAYVFTVLMGTYLNGSIEAEH